MVIEPKVQAAAGMLTAPPGYLKRIRQLCTDYNVLLIADEVATGFGRTGHMFACQEDGVTPDLMALSKGITGGYLPLAATLTTDKIYGAFLGSYDEFKTFFHGHSYTGNPLACAAALASLGIFKKERLMTRIKGKIAHLIRILAPLKQLDHVGDIRQAGLMVGIELVRDRITKGPYPLREKVGIRVCEEAQKRGMILRPLGNVIVLMPPLVTPKRELTRMVNILEESIRSITGSSC
jgi:adenosylmethionine-8-amino-7-oxononanoate aminotransferase